MSLRGLKPDPARPQSAGNQIILWRAYHLPARLYIARDDRENRSHGSRVSAAEGRDRSLC